MSILRGRLALPLVCLCFAVGQVTPPRSAIRFRNVAAGTGLQFVLENHPTPRKHLIETMPGGVAAFDYDNDGLTDIFFTNGADIPSLEKSDPKYHNRLFRNLGGMKFADATGKARLAGAGYSMAAAAADYDNDGFVDLFVAGVNRNFLYHNDGDGRFSDVSAQAGVQGGVWAVAAGWLDYDNDGLLDLFVVNYVQWSPTYDRFCGDRKDDLRVYCHPRYLEGLPNTLYRNRGGGVFEDVSRRTGIAAHVGKGMGLAIADYDANGGPDVFVTNDTEPNFLFRNRGGSFEETGLLAGVAFNSNGKAISNMGADFRDYDNDGLPDIAVTALSNETFPLFRNTGKGVFDDATYPSRLGKLSLSRAGWSVGLFDFDNDGWKDLFTANAHVNDRIERFEASLYRQANSIFLNLGDGKFDDVSASAGPDFRARRAHRGAAFADFNNDGRIDIVVSCLGEPAELWENTTSSAGNWLLLKFRGTKSNRDGIGAVVRLVRQHNHMTTAVGYASSSHSGVHFGLGSATRVPEMEIRWPSGTVQILKDVSANQVLAATEPAP